MKKRYSISATLFLIFAVLTFSYSANAQSVTGYVKILTHEWGTLDGSNGAPAQEINVTDYFYEEAVPKRNIAAWIKFTKPVDNMTNVLNKCFKIKEVLTSVQFEFYKMQGGQQVIYKTVTLTNATITQIDQNGGSETLRLSFQNMETGNP